MSSEVLRELGQCVPIRCRCVPVRCEPSPPCFGEATALLPGMSLASVLCANNVVQLIGSPVRIRSVL
eukprot:4669947-Alexandrium_andersonii.AAC.1